MKTLLFMPISAPSARLLLAGAAACANCIALPAHAAEDAAFEDAAEIVVTAQRRETRMQDTALSLSVLGAEALARRKVSQTDDLAQGLANVQSTATVGENTPLFAIRGVSISDFSLNQSSPVALYYDDVYKGNFALMGVALFDMERIEVLRGPQGALYGRNSTGGAISLVSRSPQFSNGGELVLGIGNRSRIDAQGHLNLVVGSNLAARVAFTAARADGWFRNRLHGKPDLNATREYGLRGSMLWEPWSGADITLRVATSRQTPRNYASSSIPGESGTGAGLYEAFGRGSSYFRTGLSSTETESEYTPRRRARTWSAALTGRFDLGGWTLTSITAWDRGFLYVPEDTDGSPLKTLEIPYIDRARQVSQELRLDGSLPGGGSLIAGLYASREKVFNATEMAMWTDLDIDGSGAVDAADCAEALPVACVIANRFNQRKTSLAAYADVRWPVTERVTVQGGLRLTRDTGRQYGLIGEARGVDGALVQTLIPPTTRRFGQTDLSGRLVLEWRPAGNVVAWASAGNAFRGSAFNGQAFFDPAEAGVARPEKVTALEAGMKGLSPVEGLRFGLTGFAYRYRDQQFLSVNPANAVQNLVNVSRSRIHGMEGELVVDPAAGVRLELVAGWLSTRVLEGSVSGRDLAGNRLLNAPVATGGATLTWEILADEKDTLTFTGTASYTGTQYFEILNTPRLKEPDVLLLGASLAWKRSDWSVLLWGKNLGDARYHTSRIDLSGFGFDYGHLGTPRTFGISVGRSF